MTRAELEAALEAQYGPGWRNLAFVSAAGVVRLRDLADELDARGPSLTEAEREAERWRSRSVGLPQIDTTRPPRVALSPAAQIRAGLEYVRRRYGS